MTEIIATLWAVVFELGYVVIIYATCIKKGDV